MEFYGFENRGALVGGEFFLLRVDPSDRLGLLQRILSTQLAQRTQSEVKAAPPPALSVYQVVDAALAQLAKIVGGKVPKGPEASQPDSGKTVVGKEQKAPLQQGGREALSLAQVRVSTTAEIPMVEGVVAALVEGTESSVLASSAREGEPVSTRLRNSSPTVSSASFLRPSAGKTGGRFPSGRVRDLLLAASDSPRLVPTGSPSRAEGHHLLEVRSVAKGVDPEILIAHLESILSQTPSTSHELSPEAARQLTQTIRLIGESREVFPLAATLVLQTRSLRELVRLNQALEAFFRFPESVQKALVQEFRSEAAGRLLEKFQQLVARETHRQDAKPFDKTQGKPFDRAEGRPFDSAQGKLFELRLPTTLPRSSASSLPAQAAAVVISFPEGSRPRPTAREVRALGYSLAQVVADLPSLGLRRAEVESFRAFLMNLPHAPVSRAQVEVFVKRFLRQVPLSSQTVETLLRSWNHRAPQVRFLVVHLLKELIRRSPREVAEREFIPLLKVLARDRRSLEVRFEAIRVLLDMGNGQSKGRQREEAMAELLKEIELVPLLKGLLDPKNRRYPDDIRKGLDILSQAGQYLPQEVRGELLQMVLVLAEGHRYEEVILAALGCLLTYQNDLGPRDQTRLLQKGIYRSLMTAVVRRYQRGESHFSSNSGLGECRYGT